MEISGPTTVALTDAVLVPCGHPAGSVALLNRWNERLLQRSPIIDAWRAARPRPC
jgi:hypothetical protein